MDSFKDPKVKALCKKAAAKNIVLMIARNLNEPNIREYLRAVEVAIENLPKSILLKASSPIPVVIGKIEGAGVKGLADVSSSQFGVRVGVTQMLEAVKVPVNPLETIEVGNTYNAEAIQETLVHEITHKLSFQRGKDGALLLPREDWLEIMNVNGVEFLRVMNDYQKKMMQQGHTMGVGPTYLDDLPKDEEEFLDALRSQLKNHVTYASDPVELVAFSAQNEDLSLNDPRGYEHYEGHDLAASRAVLRKNLFCESEPCMEDGRYRYWEFDGKKWVSGFLKK